MNIKDPRHDVPIWNSGCAALMCILFAALLFEACAFQLRARPGLQLGCTLMFAAQAAAIGRSIRPYRYGAMQMSGAVGRGRRFRRLDAACALLLAALGFIGMAWLVTGWALAAVLFAVLLWIVPWSRIPLCRKRLPVALAMLLLGGGALLCVARPVHSPLYLLVPAWMLWLAASGAWLRLILLKRHKARALAGYPASG